MMTTRRRHNNPGTHTCGARGPGLHPSKGGQEEHVVTYEQPGVFICQRFHLLLRVMKKARCGDCTRLLESEYICYVVGNSKDDAC